MNINSRILKISGSCEIPEDLKCSHAYKVTIEGTIPKMETTDNHNGTFDVLYKMKPVRVEIINEKGEILRAKDTRSLSELQRNQLLAIYKDKNLDMEFDKFYELTMAGYRANADRITNEIIKYHNL